jgi:DNA-binding transcriptional LysR family regulator
MDWVHLRFFVAAASAKSLSGAARYLGVNQTTVARRLESLERELGVRLFDRTSAGMVATPEGAEMLRMAERVGDDIAALERRVLGKDARLIGELRVTTVDLIALFEASLFEGFTRRYPDVALELGVGDVPRNLTRREADVAIRWTDSPPQHLVGQRVVRAEYALYGAVSLLERFPRDAALRDYPWLAGDEAAEARLTTAWMRQHVPQSRLACRYDSAIAMHAGVRAGTGLGFLPCAYGDADPALRRMRSVEPGFGMDIWVLTHPDLRGTARVRAFVEHTVTHFNFRRRDYAGSVCSARSGRTSPTS